MPTMANLVCKKADGTTDVTYTAITPSSGDKVKAEWRNESVGTSMALRPTLSVQARASANGRFRLVDVEARYPETYTDSTTGLTMLRDRNFFKGTFGVCEELTDTTNQEFAAQVANLLATTLFKQVVSSGRAPT